MLGRPTGQHFLHLTLLQRKSGPLIGTAGQGLRVRHTSVSEDLLVIRYFKDQPHRLPESHLFLDMFIYHLSNSEKQFQVQ